MGGSHSGMVHPRDEHKTLAITRAREADHREQALQAAYQLYPTSDLWEYLFKVYCDQSQGTNTRDLLQSPTTRKFGSPPFFNSMPPGQIRKLVVAYFSSENTSRDYFIHFTSSLLAALLHTERLDREGWTHVRIAVLSTGTLGAGSNIFPAAFLVRSHNIHLEDIRRLDLDEECLIWDRLEYLTSHTSLRVLRVHGFYNLLPELKQQMQKFPLGIELEAFGKQLFGTSWAMEITPNEVQVATALADVRMGRSCRTVACHLLCTRKRDANDPAYLEF